MKRFFVGVAFCLIPFVVSAQYLGQWSVNKYKVNSTGNRYGAGSPYKANSINNPTASMAVVTAIKALTFFI